MKNKKWKSAGKLAGVMLGGIIATAASSVLRNPNVMANYGYTGSGNSTGGVPTTCETAQNAITVLCPNHMGGASWRIYKVGTHYGPATPWGTAVLTTTDVNMDTISQTCSEEAGYGWFVAYGWEGMNGWNASGDAARVQTSFGEPFEGSVQIGPANYGQDLIGGAAYNDFNAVGSSLEWVENGMTDNTRLTMGATEELFCNMRINTGLDTRESCNSSKLNGVSYFCYAPEKDEELLDPAKLTVSYKATSTTNRQLCYKRVKSESEDIPMGDPVTIEDEDRDGVIDYEASISQYLNTDWEISVQKSGNVEVNGASVHMTGEPGEEASVTFVLTKEEDIPNTAECDIECESWLPDEYVESDKFDGDTKVKIGVKNNSLAGWSHPNNSDKWHHLNEPTTNLMEGPIYAKPTDDIQFKYCYYPGVERAAHETVTHENEHPEPTTMNPTTNHLYNHEFQEYDDWKFSEYRAWIDGIDAGFKPSSEYQQELEGYKEHSDIGDDEPLIGTLPGGPMAEGEKSDNNEDREYLVQPWDKQPLAILYAGGVSNKLDPGDDIQGHIATSDGVTHIHREEQEKVHEWDCNPIPCDENPEGICYQDKCSHDNLFYPNDRDSHLEQDNASVIVPYNFKNSAGVDVASDLVYSGDKIKIKNARATVGMRINKETDGPDREEQGYATDVEDGRARIVAFLMDGETYENNPESVWAVPTQDSDNYENEGDGIGRIWVSTEDVCEPGRNTIFNAKFNVCKFLERQDGYLNENSALDGATYDFISGNHYTSTVQNLNDTVGEYNVFDEAAGNYMCVAAAIYPFSVKNDKELDKDGDQSWYVSVPQCVKIWKKPSFQVWGSGLYTGGSITTSTSQKNNVLSPSGKRDTSSMDAMGGGSYEGWTPKGGTNVLFGSWGELSVTMEGTTTKFGSGAGMGFRDGYIPPNANSSWSSAGDDVPISSGYPAGFLGSEGGTLCQRSPMSIGNMNCNNYTGGFYEGMSSTMEETLSSDVEDLVAMFSPEAAATGAYTYIHNGSVTSADGVTLGSGGVVESVDRGQTIVQVQDGGLRIGKDIIFTSSASSGLSSLRDIAKYIIYARGGITIDCEVTRIDAILIANGTINTCDEGDVNDRIRSHQLVINGAVISGGLILNRTYGASTGEWSVTPAELINYDTSLYLWSNAKAESTISGQLTTIAGQSTGVSSGTSEAAVRELAPRY